MACCKTRRRSRLMAAVERQFYALRGVTCSRLFRVSPRMAGLVYRTFGVWLIAATLALAVLGLGSVVKP